MFYESNFYLEISNMNLLIKYLKVKNYLLRIRSKNFLTTLPETLHNFVSNENTKIIFNLANVRLKFLFNIGRP